VSGLFQRLAQRGAGSVAATGLAPLQLPPRSRFESMGLPRRARADDGGLAEDRPEITSPSPSAPTTPHDARAVAPHSAAMMATPPRHAEQPASEPAPSVAFRSALTELSPVAPSGGPQPRGVGDPTTADIERDGALSLERLEPATGASLVEVRPARTPPPAADRPVAASAASTRTQFPEPSASLPVAAPAMDAPAPVRPDPFAQAEPEPTPTLSIGRIEVNFLPPPTPPASRARAPGGTRGFADYSRIRSGRPR
jgi:hypothetical protein